LTQGNRLEIEAARGESDDRLIGGGCSGVVAAATGEEQRNKEEKAAGDWQGPIFLSGSVAEKPMNQSAPHELN
jgi:hypothetical protein